MNHDRRIIRALVYDAWTRSPKATRCADLIAVKNSGTTQVSYKHDGTGRRTCSTAGGTTTHHYYSDQWQVLEDRVSGTVRAQYVWSPVYVDAMVLRDRDTDSDGNLADSPGSERLYVTHDANFNVTGLFDTSANAVERFAYDPYGAVTVLDGNWALDSGNETDVSWVYLHQGGRYEWHAGIGLYHRRGRELDPELGRWIQVDPIGTSQGLALAKQSQLTWSQQGSIARASTWAGETFGAQHAADFWLWSFKDGPNLYQLVQGNPVTGTDPSGMDRYVVDGGMGHYGIAVDEWSTVNGKLIVTGVVQYDFSMEYWNPFGYVGWILFGTQGKVRSWPSIKGEVIAVIPSNACADTILKGNLDAAVISPPTYHIGFYNCNWFVLDHLLDGINVPRATAPDEPWRHRWDDDGDGIPDVWGLD